MFSLAGMPPFAGFLSKFYILLALINTSSITLVILVLLITSISAFYYIRLVKIILFEIKNNSQINHDFMGSVNYSQKTSSSLIT
jgi:NADH-quinone oxidoreductase subunit N